MVSHAANPFGTWLADDLMRVYITSRDAGNRSHITFVDVDAAREFSVRFISPDPVLVPGELGLFDDSGVAMGYLLRVNGNEHLYYLGWNLKVTVP